MFSLLPDVIVQFLDGQGKPLAGGLIYTYESGTTTLKPTFTDPEGKTPNTNPIVLDAAGRAKIYLDTGAYRVRVLSRDQVLITDTNQVSRFVNNIELAEVLKTVNDGLAELGVVQEALESLVDEAFRDQKGYAGGIAPLDGDGKIPAEYLTKIPKASFVDYGTLRISDSFTHSASLPEVALSVNGGKALAARDFGINYKYSNVTSSRSFGVEYTNDSLIAKMVYIETTSGGDGGVLTVKLQNPSDGEIVELTLDSTGGSHSQGFSGNFLIPPAIKYTVNSNRGLKKWVEAGQ